MTEEAVSPAPSGYPVTYDVEPQHADRNRLTVAFRAILAIPHSLLVGGPSPLALIVSWGSLLGWLDIPDFPPLNLTWAGNGVVSLAVFVGVFISWFAIVITGRQPRGLWDFTNFYMRWVSNATAYMALLRDEYPPFGSGDGKYPVTFDASAMSEQRSRLSVAFRIILVIPHALILFFLGLAWWVTVAIGWLAVLLTGRYPEGLYGFGVGYWRWSIRVQAYMLLMRDDYPPFGFD